MQESKQIKLDICESELAKKIEVVEIEVIDRQDANLHAGSSIFQRWRPGMARKTVVLSFGKVCGRIDPEIYKEFEERIFKDFGENAGKRRGEKVTQRIEEVLLYGLRSS